MADSRCNERPLQRLLAICLCLAAGGTGTAQTQQGAIIGAAASPHHHVDPGKLGASVHLGVAVDLWPAWAGSFIAAKPIIFHWKVANLSPIAVQGNFELTVDHHALASTGLPKALKLSVSEQQSGDLAIAGLAAGTHTVSLRFLVPTGSIDHVPLFASAGSNSTDVKVIPAPPAFVDADADGLDDNLEHDLLEHYRPYFRFTKPGWQEKIQGEPDWDPYPPIDVATYLSHSEAGWAHGFKMSLFDKIVDRSTFELGNFNALIAMSSNSDDTCTNNGASCLSNLVKNARKANYAIQWLDLPDSKAAFEAELSARNIGLYGHVVPYDPSSSQGQFQQYFRSTDALDLGGGPKRFVKVEYWQFFPQNGGPAPHGGDWDTVQLLIDFGPDDLPCEHSTGRFGQISSVFHYHHGAESRFEFRSCQSGPTFNGDFADYSTLGDSLELFRDGNGDFAHPVVYIEYATHEFWPSAAGYVAGAPGHSGDGAAFLTNTPPNLGEVEAPLGEYPNAAALMRFNGFWGRCCIVNLPPPGPALHSEWTYPASSSIRWQLEGQTEP